MANFVPVVIKDAATTNHTFKPRNIAGGVATWVESTGVPIGDRKITASVSRSATGRAKAILKLAVPIVQDATVNGVTRPTAVRTAYADLTFSFDGTSSTAERHDMISYLLDLLVEPGVFELIRDLEPIYG